MRAQDRVHRPLTPFVVNSDLRPYSQQRALRRTVEPVSGPDSQTFANPFFKI